MSSSTKTGSRWVVTLAFAVLVIGMGIEGITSHGVEHTGIDHRTILAAIARAVISGFIVLFVMAVGVLVATALRRKGGRGVRWFPNTQEPFPFPLWLRILVAAAAIFFLVFLVFLFYLLAPRRKHQQASIARLGVSASVHIKGPPPVLTHFDYLLPILLGLSLLVLLGIVGILRQRALRRKSLGRGAALLHRPQLASQLAPIQELEHIDDPRVQIFACWQYVEARLTQIGFTRVRYESPTEFVRRIEPTFTFPILELQTLATLFAEARYSDHRVSQRDGQLAYTLATLIDASCTRTATNA
ncbi:DUF4129 domain-containing protein [Ferrimicrobium sp.]|uniref:DUF4129 domain-containing protein n=1 Tax=Ferrimicrobium sp. TaxID=2926050 RepID=UPI002632AF4C|nr:DUF4129 domain-containing protein [Ferrimicrobium sp.]